MTRLQANLMLLAASALWGFGNVAQKTVLEHLDPMSAVGLRSLIGLLLLLPLMKRTRRSQAFWISALRVAAPFALAMAVQQYAYLSTSVTNASFLINAATVMTPAIAWMMLGERPTRLILTAATFTLLGAMMLSGGFDGKVGAGDMAAALAAICFAVWLVELSRHMREHGDAVATACTQFAVAALATLPFGALFGNLSLDNALAAGPDLIMLGVFSTAIAFSLQTVAQRYTSGSHAAIIISAESLFGAAGGSLLLGEQVSALQALGCALVLTGIVMAALPARTPVTRAARSPWARRRTSVAL